MHYGPEQPRIQTEVLGHSLVRSLIRSQRSLVFLLRTAHFAALSCLLARSLHSLPCSWESKWLDGYFICVFFSILDHSVMRRTSFLPSQSTSKIRLKIGMRSHYGSKQLDVRPSSDSLFHELRSERVSERCKRTSQPTNEWPNTYVAILGWSKV